VVKPRFLLLLDRILEGTDGLGCLNIDRKDAIGILAEEPTIESKHARHGLSDQ
jgi:hypothetical protein